MSTKAFAEVTGEKVNRGAGYRLEIPCVYLVTYVIKAKRTNRLLECCGTYLPQSIKYVVVCSSEVNNVLNILTSFCAIEFGHYTETVFSPVCV